MFLKNKPCPVRPELVVERDIDLILGHVRESFGKIQKTPYYHSNK